MAVSALRTVSFMGWFPHCSRDRDAARPARGVRVHHSSFMKPVMEHVAIHYLAHPPQPGAAAAAWASRPRLRRKLGVRPTCHEGSLRQAVARGAEAQRLLDEVCPSSGSDSD